MTRSVRANALLKVEHKDFSTPHAFRLSLQNVSLGQPSVQAFSHSLHHTVHFIIVTALYDEDCAPLLSCATPNGRRAVPQNSQRCPWIYSNLAASTFAQASTTTQTYSDVHIPPNAENVQNGACRISEPVSLRHWLTSSPNPERLSAPHTRTKRLQRRSNCNNTESTEHPVMLMWLTSCVQWHDASPDPESARMYSSLNH